jgi:dolichyl-phosphooligosaccharide-protein glycotransferase
MEQNKEKNYNSYFIFIIIILLMLFSIWIRGIYANSMDLSHYITDSSPDIWYNFRQIELMAHNFPQYSWFDPMTAYPVGKSIDWGPLLPFIGSSIILLFGQTSRPEMMVTVSWIGPIFASFMVPLLYFLGKHLWDWKTGLLSAAFITCLSGLYFTYSYFGIVDHHILETFTSTIFCLFYLFTLFYWKKHSTEFNKSAVLIPGAGLSILTGLLYFIGYLNIPTIILFGLIIAIYTFFQFILDNWKNKNSGYLFITNLGIFCPVIILMSVFGVHQPGLSFQQYSIAQIFAIAVIIAETILLYFLSRKMQNNIKTFLLSIFGVIITLFLATRLLLGDMIISQLMTFFGQAPETSGIAESIPWNIVVASNSFHIALFLTLVGFIILLYQLYMKKIQEHLFLVIWSFVVFIGTVQHYRFEYYFVVNIALLSSLCIVTGMKTGLAWVGPDIRISSKFIIHLQNIEHLKQNESQSKQKIKGKKETGRNLLNNERKLRSMKVIGFIILFSCIILAILTVALSIQNDVKYSTTSDRLINKNWVETLEWISLHTPDTGLEYLGLYSRNNFSYPKQSYGIMTWWDYGHYITFISKRIPNTNPFQDNLIGPSGAAAFYMADSELNGTRVLDSLGSRYVITDTNIVTDKFSSVAIWYDNKSGWYPFMKSFYMHDPANNNKLLKLNGEFEPYYHIISVRLHNFDGSVIKPGNVIYFEYYNENRAGLAYPIVTKSQILPAEDAKKAVQRFNANAPYGKQAIEVGQILQPIEKVPALQHFRLIHESSGNSSGIQVYDNSKVDALNLVKIFEYVPGAHIKGNGVVELKIITNTGREFIYQQESVNGEYIVPYSTLNNPYEVQASGNYHIIGTEREIGITEEDVMLGNIIVA